MSSSAHPTPVEVQEPFELTAKEKVHCGQLAALLTEAFDWGASPEGRKYWRDVCASLRAHAGKAH